MHSSQCSGHGMKNLFNFRLTLPVYQTQRFKLQVWGFKLSMSLIPGPKSSLSLFIRTWITTITFYQELKCHCHFLPGPKTSPWLTRKVTSPHHFIKKCPYQAINCCHFLSVYTPSDYMGKAYECIQLV